MLLQQQLVTAQRPTYLRHSAADLFQRCWDRYMSLLVRWQQTDSLYDWNQAHEASEEVRQAGDLLNDVLQFRDDLDCDCTDGTCVWCELYNRMKRIEEELT